MMGVQNYDACHSMNGQQCACHLAKHAKTQRKRCEANRKLQPERKSYNLVCCIAPKFAPAPKGAKFARRTGFDHGLMPVASFLSPLRGCWVIQLAVNQGSTDAGSVAAGQAGRLTYEAAEPCVVPAASSTSI
jgi:hypothetical protein